MNTVIIQGGVGSYSEQAARFLLGPSAVIRYHDSFDTALAEYRRHNAWSLLLPWWNQCIGPIHAVQVGIHHYGLVSRGSLLLLVRHCLISNRRRDPDRGGRVASHPVALAQCRRFFRANPQLRPYLTSDTDDSVASLVRGDHRHAFAIASREAAEIHGMDVVRANIGDHPDNRTLFRFYG